MNYGWVKHNDGRIATLLPDMRWTGEGNCDDPYLPSERRWEGNYFAAMLGDITTLIKMLEHPDHK